MAKTYLASAMAVGVLFLTGCSQGPKPSSAEETEAKKEQAGPVEPVTAKTAFWPMYTSARNWTTDFLTLKLTSKEIPGFKNEAGKAAMWEATFGSPSRQEYRVYSYAIAAHPPDIYKGVTVGRALPWGGVTRDVMPVLLSEFNIDSDTAYKAAAGDAAEWLKKNSDKPLASLELGNAHKFQTPVWFLMWGTHKSGYVAFVNAATGRVLKAK